ncbi:acyltransferase [Veillonella caviae]|uniref:acyltransferase family protein n=1 Tax=Veillonella caviae TaxID=248316 RepID=UPI0023F7CDC0|nr:acyltransferase [Veillonella caviae]MCI7693455.1 acyltransferase [Veillonella caviae]MDD7290234.1 acyltransferase [Veillonella caviae]MDY5254392.1 acyltransferase [Veillonella caviae]MDY5787814.1 acyltransferase [Veillonella caviae]
MMVKWVNIAKGIAIFLVVYGHVIDGLADSGYTFASYEVQHGIIYSFHMPLFFFLSGLFFDNMLKRELLTVIKSRALSLLYPYFLWGIIQGSIMAILSKFTNSGAGWEKVLLLPIDPFGQFWYLYDLFFMILLYLGLYKLVKNKSTVLIFAIAAFVATPFMDMWEFSRIFHHFIFLVLGAMFFDFESWFEVKKIRIFIVLIIASLCSFWAGLNLLNFLIFGLVGTGITVVLAKIVRNNRFLELLGIKSLSIYLFHILALAGSRIVLTKFWGFENIPILIVTLTIIGILLPLIADNVAERLKMTKYIYGKGA